MAFSYLRAKCVKIQTFYENRWFFFYLLYVQIGKVVCVSYTLTPSKILAEWAYKLFTENNTQRSAF